MRWTLPILALALLPTLKAQPSPRSLKELRAFYAANCVKCHGPDGSGRSALGKPLKGTDFTDAERMATRSDDMMVKTIRKGIFFGVVMHPFKRRVTDSEARLLVQEILRKAQKGKVIRAAE